MIRYVFGPPKGGWLLVHVVGCFSLAEGGVYRECPPEVVALIKVAKEQAYNLPTSRNIGLCGHCFRGEI